MNSDLLRETLVALASKLKSSGIQLIVCGGYGLLLRAQVITAVGRTARFDLVPQFRSTSDLDCFLSVDAQSQSPSVMVSGFYTYSDATP